MHLWALAIAIFTLLAIVSMFIRDVLCTWRNVRILCVLTGIFAVSVLVTVGQWPTVSAKSPAYRSLTFRVGSAKELAARIGELTDPVYQERFRMGTTDDYLYASSSETEGVDPYLFFKRQAYEYWLEEKRGPIAPIRSKPPSRP